MKKKVIPLIEANFEMLSPTDQVIADFFIKNKESRSFKADNIAKELFVSKAALSRFAKKIGFSGYREFISFYKEEIENSFEMKFTNLTQRVLYTYQEIQEKSYTLIDEMQIQRVVEMISLANKVYIYGYGNSGLAALEFKMRFMRLGLNIEAITDMHLMKMNDVVLNKGDLLIVLSISGLTLQPFIEKAASKNIEIISMTANLQPYIKEYSNEVIICPSTKHLDVGNLISPQLPFLLLIDVIYAFYLSKDSESKIDKLENTLKYLEERVDGARG